MALSNHNSQNMTYWAYLNTNNGGSTRSYIPTAIFTPVPEQSSTSGSVCFAVFGTYTQDTSIVLICNAGGNGENGYFLISY